MVFFFKRNKNKNEKPVINTYSRSFYYGDFSSFYYGDSNSWGIVVTVTIAGFRPFLNNLLLDSYAQELWNDIKEKFGKEVDEEELFKVFALYFLIVGFLYSMEDAKQKLFYDIDWNYGFYSNPNYFNGKLDKAKFEELFKKIVEYCAMSPTEDRGKQTEQKDEQSK